MKLVRNWKRIAWASWSMRAIYAGIAVLVVPELLFIWLGRDVISPYLTAYGGLALLVLGGIGRLIDQGIGDE